MLDDATVITSDFDTTSVPCVYAITHEVTLDPSLVGFEAELGYDGVSR